MFGLVRCHVHAAVVVREGKGLVIGDGAIPPGRYNLLLLEHVQVQIILEREKKKVIFHSDRLPRLKRERKRGSDRGREKDTETVGEKKRQRQREKWKERDKGKERQR